MNSLSIARSPLAAAVVLLIINIQYRLVSADVYTLCYAVETVSKDETRKVLIGEDPKQEARPKKRLETADCICLSAFHRNFIGDESLVN